MNKIKVWKGYETMVDSADYDWLNQYTWVHQKSHGRNIYATTSIVIEGKHKQIKMHRLIMELETGDKRMVDHIDGNGLNNQRSNLRICTSSQNSMNRKAIGRVPYKGVTLNKSRLERHRKRDNAHIVSYYYTYCAMIGTKENRKTLGRFPKTACGLLLAAVTYDIEASKIFGEFAKLNYPLVLGC